MANSEELTLKIEGMHCAGCVSVIEKGVDKLNGVDSCNVNLAIHSATIEFDSEITSEKIIQTIEELGYKATIGRPDILAANEKERKKTKADFILSFVLALPLMVIAMSPMFFGHIIFGELYNAITQAVLAGIVIFYSGKSIIKDAFLQTRYFRANMNSLIAMGSLSAYFWSLYVLYKIMNGKTDMLYFESGAMIITLILLGRFLEAKSKGKAGEAIEALLKLTPSKAMAVINGVEIEIDTSVVKEGMTLLVRPGERIPADGKLTENNPFIDESMLTGESMPVEKKESDSVYGGSLNGTIPFKMIVTASGDKTFLASIIRLVSDAQSKKAPVQKLADRVSSVFVPIVLGIALITAACWYFFAPNDPMFIRSVISVLIIACPCSLGLATPTAILAGTGRAAKEGIIIRGGDILEKVTKVDSIIFDKTGTLTHGELEIAFLKSFGEKSDTEFLTIVASAEKQSEHPVANAIVKHAENNKVEFVTIQNIESLPGAGLKGDYDGRKLLIGNKHLMDQENIDISTAEKFAEDQMDKGRTIVYAALENRVIGVIALADKIRSEAKEVIGNLRKIIKEVTMLSGDSRKTACGVARSIGLENFEAEVRPDQKQMIVESLQKAGYTIAMVGDGINDAPALAKADVGIAIGTGTDIAIESSDIVLVQTELYSVEKLFVLSKQTLRVIKQNLFWAFIYNILAIPVAAGLFYPIFGITLSPMLAAAAMSFSSLFVVSNSLRLNKLEL